jgi:hypothetical protein
VYLEELRDFCPPLRSDLPLSTWIDSMSRRGAQHNKPGLDDKMMAVRTCVRSPRRACVCVLDRRARRCVGIDDGALYRAAALWCRWRCAC